MQRVYEVRLLVKAESITVVLDVVKDSADLISMTQVSEIEVPKRARTKKNPDRPKGIKARDVIVETLKTGPSTIERLERAMKTAGFATTSARVATNEMIRANQVTKSDNGIYVLSVA